MGKVRAVTGVALIALFLALIGCGGGGNTLRPNAAGSGNPALGSGGADGGGGVAWWDKDLTGVFPVRMNPQPVEQTGGWPTGRQASGALSTGTGAQSAQGAGLPAPAELAKLLSPAKQAAYTDADLVKAGAEFDPTLPNNRVSTVVAPSVIFSPIWGGQAHPTLTDAAYCIYRFSLAGYADSGAPQTLALAWYPGSEPTDYANLWVGLGNRGKDRWEWYAGPPDGVLTLDSYAPYTAGNGDVLVAIVLLGSDECALASLKVGAPELRAMGAMPNGTGEDLTPPPAGGGSLPSSVDLSPDCSPVGDQGQIGSCTSFATARGAFDYELGQVYEADGWDFSDPFNLSSTKYLYLLTGDEQGLGCPDGRYTDGVIDYLKREGDSSELNAPYVNVCTEDWGDEAIIDSTLLKIEDYSGVDPTGNTGVVKLKAILALQRKPLVLQTGVDWSFFNLGPDEVWDYTGGVIAGYHAMCLVGYDDALSAFKVRNSWGTGWSSEGYCWIGYQTFLDGDPDLALWAWTLDVDYSAAVAQRFCGQEQELAPPTDVQASDGTYPDKIRVTWTKSDGATGYDVYRDARDNRVATLLDVALWDDTGISDYLGHTYWVQATKPGSTSSLSAPDTGYLALAPVILDVQPQSGDPGEVVTFSATVQGSPSMTYAWDFGGGATPNTSSEVSPLETLGAEGSYNASLTVTNDYGNDVFAFTLLVQQPGNTPPVADLQITPPSGDPGVIVTLDASGSYDPDPGDSIVKYEFDFGEGGGWEDFGTTNSTTHQYAIAGLFTLRVRVTDTNSATDVASCTLPVLGSPSLLTLPEHVDRDTLPGYVQIFMDEPRVRRDGRLLISMLNYSVSPVDPIGYSDILKTNGVEFPVSIGGDPLHDVYPVIVIKETSNPDDITGPDDAGAIPNVLIPLDGGREAGRINVDITSLLLNLPPPIPGDTHQYCYKLYDAADSEIGWGEFDVPDNGINPSPPLGVDWGINAGDRSDWLKDDFNTLCTNETLDGSTMTTPTPDVFWVRFNGGTRMLDWNEYWNDDDANTDNLQLVLKNAASSTMAVKLLPVIIGVTSDDDYIAIHHFDFNDGAGYYYDWVAGAPGDGILSPGNTYDVYLDDPATGWLDFCFPDQLIVTGSNPNPP